jgi:hypothetical protein
MRDGARILGLQIGSMHRHRRPKATAESLFDAFTRAGHVDRLSAFEEARYRLGQAVALVEMPATYRAQIELALAELDQAHTYDVARATEWAWFGAFGVLKGRP